MDNTQVISIIAYILVIWVVFAIIIGLVEERDERKAEKQRIQKSRQKLANDMESLGLLEKNVNQFKASYRKVN